jgi:hypothetical protein
MLTSNDYITLESPPASQCCSIAEAVTGLSSEPRRSPWNVAMVYLLVQFRRLCQLRECSSGDMT